MFFIGHLYRCMHLNLSQTQSVSLTQSESVSLCLLQLYTLCSSVALRLHKGHLLGAELPTFPMIRGATIFVSCCCTCIH